MNTSIVFDPLLPIWLIITLTVLIVIASMAGEWRGLRSQILRTLAAFILCGALLNPQKVLEDRTALPDIAVILADESASMTIADRADIASKAQEALRTKLDSLENIETVILRVATGQDGTRLTQTMIDGLGQLPADRLAGIFAITDGQIHDLPTSSENLLPAGVPFHALIVGNPNARDRRLEAIQTPKYGLVGEDATFEVRIDDPGHEGERALLEIRLNGDIQARFRAIIGNSISIPLKIEKRGVNTIEIRTETAPDELTPINNFLVSEISGVRDRLRVLLVTGEPHMGGRAWRNLLKSDPSVDLVQFTILTNPGPKNASANANELSLISFPVRELFEEKLHEFDLVIFDQFRRRTSNAGGRVRSMLPPYYIDNVSKYVENGGALLVATGKAFAGEQSLARSPLIAVLPARPTGEIEEGAFRPNLNEKGKRHPITSDFDGETSARWGRWYRTIDTEIINGDVLMVNDDNKPLLVVSKMQKGRVAMVLSDHAWLWAKGHDGGGPYNEMFRRLSHWLMGEPDLEADRLNARIQGEVLNIEQFALNDGDKTVQVLGPDGKIQTIELQPIGPGHYSGTAQAVTQGAYRVTSGDITTVAAAGALNPREFKHVLPTADILEPLVKSSQGASFWLGNDATLPDVRKVKARAIPKSAKFAGLLTNNRYTVTASRRTPFGPTWLYFLLILFAMLGAWRLEGK